ncbi:MAG: potassium/proton antiporter [Dysgonamonadaceae bacterium]|jgi:cell volume regulation protein A|nr:potassium/proton antiporter [Dysgonamonadaceae bacterium]
MMIATEHFLLFISVLFFISLFATKAGFRFGVPVLLLFLAIGMIFGSDGIGFEFHNYNVAQAIGTLALCIILFSGGLDTKLQDIKPVAAQGIILATIGVFLTALITGTFIYYLVLYFFPSFNLSFSESLLLAAVMSSTDSASVFSILRGKGIRLKKNLRPLLELESGSNDPMAYLLTVVLIQLIGVSGADSPGYGQAALDFFLQFSIGIVAGYLFGRLAVYIINKIDLDNDSLYPILLCTFGIFIFSATYFLKGNGYLAVYISGLVIGNSKIVHKRSSLRFFDGLAWISQMLMFLTLGLLVNPRDLGGVALISLIIGIFMIIAGRPLAVFLSLIPFPAMNFNGKIFISWVGLRGAVPIIFAILPLAAGLEKAPLIFNIVFFITLLSLLVQGTTLTQVARWLGLAKKGEDSTAFQDFDIEFSEEIKSTMSEIAIAKNSLSKGNRLMDMPLPDQTLAVMVKRNNQYFIPKGNTELAPGDKLFVITNDENALIETYKNLGIKNYRLRRN